MVVVVDALGVEMFFCYFFVKAKAAEMITAVRSLSHLKC